MTAKLLSPEAIDAACQAMAITIAKQDGVTLTPAGYRQGAKQRPEEHALMLEYVAAGLQAALSRTPDVQDKAPVGWKEAEDWENACHELFWETGNVEQFELIQKLAEANAKERAALKSEGA